MDISRLCSIQGGADEAATHQRISEYVKPKLEKYPGRGFTAEHEWTVEQTIEALREMLGDVSNVTPSAYAFQSLSPQELFRECASSFLNAASKELPGKP